MDNREKVPALTELSLVGFMYYWEDNVMLTILEGQRTQGSMGICCPQN